MKMFDLIKKADEIKVVTCEKGYNGYTNNSGIYEYTTRYERINDNTFKESTWSSCDFDDDYEELGNRRLNDIINFIDGIDEEREDVYIYVDGVNVWNII